ncbi:Protein TILB like protein [Dufourea novaeangliae]|uniref:Protein TILB like protein n=1 Tax=Dufourea novaeangliae TaxID=178035 RepID=A0A154PM45_DUFNO|nr:Protein TILB like protein [Dufourea novaeangliae]
MPRITLDLVRKRSEHNEGEIATLVEIALHQENIEKIELLDRACKDLKILLLQNNLIAKIENLSRLKRLEYLNLALNNIEAIENLEGLESLRKLDLTVNFIGDLRGIQKLRCNDSLEQLFLMGNPCADYDGYRAYTVATLTQLKELDGTPVERSERIKALQSYSTIEGEIIRSFGNYKTAREEEIVGHRASTAVEDAITTAYENENEEFWNRVSRHTPEERVMIAKRSLQREERQSGRQKETRIINEPKLFNSEGKACNANQPRIPFKLKDDEPGHVVLQVSVYKYLDTDYVDVNVQPDYIRVTIKGKILQLRLPCEVSVEGSKAKRDTTTGKLVVTMPRLNPLPILRKRNPDRNKEPIMRQRSSQSIRQYLEIGPPSDELDFSRIVDRNQHPARGVARAITECTRNGCNDRDDCDDSDVPALE